MNLQVCWNLKSVVLCIRNRWHVTSKPEMETLLRSMAQRIEILASSLGASIRALLPAVTSRSFRLTALRRRIGQQFWERKAAFTEASRQRWTSSFHKQLRRYCPRILVPVRLIEMPRINQQWHLSGNLTALST